ncbi:MAG: hypothetical protein HQK63_14330 [Desulfamplus sp.]|nr:hypothetical protein [Desulfamplus sp.]
MKSKFDDFEQEERYLDYLDEFDEYFELKTYRAMLKNYVKEFYQVDAEFNATLTQLKLEREETRNFLTQKEKELDEKEQALEHKEQQLLQKEKEFYLKLLKEKGIDVDNLNPPLEDKAE